MNIIPLQKILKTLLLFLLITGAGISLSADEQKKCLIVASYHDEFIGQKLKVDAAIKELQGKCEIKQFNMDSKRHPEVDFIEKKALEAKLLIDSWNPDVVIAIEDNASKYLVMKYYKNATIPIVFSGVDWTAEKYGYPYENVTGMIEISPIMQLLQHIQVNISGVNNGIMIRPNRFSAEKNYERAKNVFASANITLEDGIVNTFEDFKEIFLKAQEKDFILFTNNAAIENWNDEEAKEFIASNVKKLIVTQSDWMIPFAILGVNKVIEEQGEYAAQVAIEILNGAKPSDFPIVSNRKWNTVINYKLLQKSGFELSPVLVKKSKLYQ